MINWINNVLTGLSKLEDNKGNNILNECGKACSEKSNLYQGATKVKEQYSDEKNIDILFNAFKSQYYNSERFTKKGNTITLIFNECTCPMVKKGVDNSFLCNCTTGYSKKIFETLFDKEVIIDLEKSILREDSICKQIIQIKE